MNILIKTGFYFGQSVYIIFTWSVFEKKRKGLLSRICENIVDTFKILFCLILIFYFDLHLQIIEIISPKASVENSSALWAIFD